MVPTKSWRRCAGGMGEVYRARDTRLDRVVALKVLATRFGSLSDLRTRFEREARTISQFQHPHICTLFDVGRHEDTDYLVMEFLEGDSLAKRVSDTRLPPDQVLRIGQEIAAALHAAHRRGIVHRDLKPGNVMLTGSGTKLLDFGLAKIAGAGPQNEAAPTASVPEAVTREGAVLGTIQYMAPEQLEGKEADSRSDIWALGCVLYEMATGSRAFEGTSQASVIAAILNSQPVRLQQKELPAGLERVIRHCLARDPEARWQSAQDVKLQLEILAVNPAETVRERKSNLRRNAALLIGLFLILGAMGLGFRVGRGRPGIQPRMKVEFDVLPPEGGEFRSSVDTSAFAVSPDGTMLAYVAWGKGEQSRVWVRRISEVEAAPLEGTDGARSVLWSPDGKSIAFFAAGKLKRVALSGGAPVTICATAPWSGFSGTWGVSGDILFSSVIGDAIYRVSAGGGEPLALIRPDESRNEMRTVWPQYLADSEDFLYLSRKADSGYELMLAAPGDKPRALQVMSSKFQFLNPDTIIFVRDGVLLGQRFDRKALKLTGEPFSIAPKVCYFYTTGWAPIAASNGTLIFQHLASVHQLSLMDRAGQVLRLIGPQNSSMVGQLLTARISPDGKKLAFDRTRPETGTYDVWIYDLARDTETRITSAPDTEFGAVWLPDGKRIIYSAVRTGAPQLVLRDLATGKEQILLPRPTFQIARDVSPDGRSVAFTERNKNGRFEALVLALTEPHKETPILSLEGLISDIKFSPDGRYAAYISDASGRPEAYVTNLAAPGEPIRFSKEGALALRWTRDGKEILYLSMNHELMSQPIKIGTDLELGNAVRLFSLPANTEWENFDVAPDGQRILAVVRESSGNAQPARVIVGWQPEAQGVAAD